MEQKGIGRLDKALLLIIIFIPCILIRQLIDNDFWFILNNGRYVLSHGIPYIEPFTMHNGLSYVMQQWLTSVFFWTIYSNLGSAGMSALIIITYVGLTYTIYKICMRISGGNFLVSFALSLFSSIYISEFMVQRPFIFFILFASIEIYLLESFIAEEKIKYLLPLPIISIFLVNIQAAMWPMLFIIIMPYIIDSYKFKFFIIKGQGYPKKAFFTTVIAMILAGFINPYGYTGMTYLFRSYGYKEISNYIIEMKPLNVNSFIGFEFFLGLFAVIMTYIVYRKGKTRLRYVLLTMGTGFMALSSIRNFSIFCICGITPLAFYLKDLKAPESNNAKAEKSKLNVVLRGLIIISMGILIVFTLNENYQDAREQQRVATLPGAVNYILKNTDTKNIVLYTGYNDGGYAEFMGLKPYIDPRAEVFVKTNNKKFDIMKEYYSLQYGVEYYRGFLNKYKFTHLIVPRYDILYKFLYYDKDYKIVYSNKDYRVYEKK